MRVFALCVLQFTALVAQATCMFARDTKPQDWYQWAQVLVAGDVAGIERRGSVDVVSLRIVETFKGPGGVQTATLGTLRGRFVIAGDAILSFYANATGRYRGFECIQQRDEARYSVRGAMMEEDKVLSTWALELTAN